MYTVRTMITTLIVSTSLFCPACFAEDYYVDRNHPQADDWNPGTEDEPFETIQAGVDVAQPGDTVLIKGHSDPDAAEAVYHVTGSGVTAVRPGEPDNPITIRSYAGHTVIIEGNGGAWGIDLDNASYHVFKGLIFRNFDKAAEGYAAKTDILMENCEFTQTYETGLRLRNIDTLVMRDCYVHHCFETGISLRDSVNVTFERVRSSYNDDGLGGAGDADGFAVNTCDNVHFIACEAIGNAEDGVDFHNNGTMIDSIIADNGACNIKVWRRSTDNYAEKSNTIINTIVYGAGEAGIKVSRGPSLYLYNSVVYGNGEEGVAFRGIEIEQGPAVVSSQIVNTIITENGWGGIEVLQSGPNVNEVIAEHNLYFNNGGSNIGLTSDTDFLAGEDPLFSEAEVGDFHLTAWSPAIDQGKVLSEVTTDFDGQPRPYGSAPDIGADEFVGGIAPVYRFWSPVKSRHFYTTSASERDKLMDQYAHVWTYEDVAFWVFADDGELGVLPVHRFWSDRLSAHFYTISEAEMQKLVDTYSYTWAYEGIALYAYPEGLQPVDASPVYRFWSGTLGCHFYTISETEKQKLINLYSHVWTYEGIAWYAYPK